ncbi:TerD family protein [Ruminococcus sp. HUN007]|uniref:TerD family protein n=1 Tax=Ruminococcus sp. HUN007 TaxID=1514668 RepID=UPI0006785FB1|nr:TerD family protein [Ruminococcus sp. HUN007]
MSDNKIQQLIDSGNGVVKLPAGEFRGPFYVSRPCTVEGNGTTLWNSDDNVFIIDSPDVTLKDLRIEMIDPLSDGFSVCSRYPFSTENVEIIGPTAGAGDEDTVPDMSKQIKLGAFRAGTANSYVIELYSPSEGQIVTDMQDVTLDPSALTKGINRITVTTSSLPSGTFIYGDLLMKTFFNRRFYLQGTASDTAEAVSEKTVLSADQDEIDLLKDAPSRNAEMLKELRRPEPPAPAEKPDLRETQTRPANNAGSPPRQTEVRSLVRGERINIDAYSGEPLRVYMSYRGLFKDIDIDPYAFMLDASGVTSCDDDFVFFGNRETMSGAITFMDDGSIELDLKKVPEHIKKISFVYSIYQPGPGDNFSKVMEPFIAVVQCGREIMRYTASELFAETTIIFMEIYKHGTGWKLNTIGQGYREGLKRLCASYGLIVS